jgi:myo-inositol-1(or 4)-monophosphatase
MHPLLTIAIRAARSAGKLITRSLHRVDTLKVNIKAQNDFVSEVDRQAEDIIIQNIHRSYPDHNILAEESGQQKKQQSDYEWIIDPLDGTTNFLHEFPQFAVSIAVKEKGRLYQAVIYDPLRDELFTASQGQGAMLNNRRLRVSQRNGLDGALLGTGFPFKQQQHLDTYLATFRALFPMTAGIRRAGAASLDLAYVAAGRLDGFWELGLSPWDIAAGILLIQESGGLVSDFSGGNEYFRTGNVIAGNPRVFKEISQAIAPHIPDTLR